MSERRIAMWSGPRNISTAMMYSFDNRQDTSGLDEPLYAHYLNETGILHPGAKEVISAGETDISEISNYLAGPIPQQKNIWYQKHMTHHLLPGFDLGWIDGLTNCMLIRDPKEVILSLAKKTDQIDARATGITQQTVLLDYLVEKTGRAPIIIDSRDILLDPRGMLEKLCISLGIPFSNEMLSWPKGPKQCDGVWAAHWYDVVWDSTGFAPYRARSGVLSPELQKICDECQPHYQRLHSLRLQ